MNFVFYVDLTTPWGHMKVVYAEEFQKWMHNSIPLTDAMKLEISSWESHAISLYAPLEENINPHGTLFGGSIASALVMAGWCLLTKLVKEYEYDAHVVVAESNVTCRRPVNSGCTVEAEMLENAVIELQKALQNDERYSIKLKNELKGANGKTAAYAECRYVVIPGF